MSVKFIPVQWNANKWFYDGVLLVAVTLYIWLYIMVATPLAGTTLPIDGAVVRMRAFGTCAYFMLTAILCIGPLARLNPRFLPLLYNRRHFGVLTALVAMTHALYVMGWYFSFSPTDPIDALFTANTSFGQILGFPFEIFGILALAILAVLAATSHDFWLSFLTPPVWKGLHLGIYGAYVAVVAHVALGYLQDGTNPTFAVLFALCAVAVVSLHVAALMGGERRAVSAEGWVDGGPINTIEDGRARIVTIRGDERAAVFRIGDTLSAVSNACAHQNGPLGEGRVIDGCITCPWHGFQYRPEDGCSPAPFTEKISTYALKLDGGHVFVADRANAPGTAVPPLYAPTSALPPSHLPGTTAPPRDAPGTGVPPSHSAGTTAPPDQSPETA